MGDFSKEQSYRRQDKKNFPVKLIEPSTGRIVELEVTSQNEVVAKTCMELLQTYAEVVEQFGANWSVTGKTIRIIFDDDNMAEIARQTWRE